MNWIGIGIGALIVYALVFILQVKNLHKFKDGNGQEKTRLLFMAQIVILFIWTASRIFDVEQIAYICSAILAFNALAFYKNWDILKWRKWFKK